MVKKVNWTDEAFTWLEEVHNYIALDKPETAKRIAEEIYHKADILEDFPEIGYRMPDYPHHHVRALLYGHYRIVYEIKKSGQIDVLGVFHGSLDLKKYLQIDDE